MTRCRVIATQNSTSRGGAFGASILGKGGHSESSIVPFEIAMLVSCRLYIVTIALSLSIRPQFAIECLRRSNQQGVGHFGSKIWGYSLRVHQWCWTGSEHPRLNNREIIFREFQPTWPKYLNVTDRRTDRRLAVAIGEIAYQQCLRLKRVTQNDRLICIVTSACCCVVAYVGWLQLSSTRRVFASVGFALKFVALTDDYRRRSTFSVCFECIDLYTCQSPVGGPDFFVSFCGQLVLN